MSVATKNPFSVLDQDEGASTPSTLQPAPAAPAPAPPRGGSQRGSKSNSRGGAPSAGSRPQQSSAQTTTPAEDYTESPKGKYDNDKGGRGRGGGRKLGRGRKNTFEGRLDRQSATGKTDSEKRVQQSWGGTDGEAELKVEEAATKDVAAETGDWAGLGTGADDTWGAPPAASEPVSNDKPATDEGAKPAEREGRPRREEEEDDTLTLDQYLAKKNQEIVPKLEGTRLANEGADESIWDGAVELKKADDTYYAGREKSAPKQRTKKEKAFIEIEARFDRPLSSSRRGRGGDRGRAPRGERGGRGSRQIASNNRNVEVDVDDTTAFPSLT